MTEKNSVLRRGTSSFNLMGEVAKIGQYTFQIDEESSKSDWKYNRMSLGINCGEECGYVYGELMGGFSPKDTKIYAHGKDDEGHDKFDERLIIDWEDRFDDEILNTVGNRCFYRAGLKYDKNDKVVTERFLHAYDFIKYLKDNIEEGMVVSVSGDLRYSFYEGKTQIKKEVKSVYLVDEKRRDPKKYSATFKQAVLFDKDCLDIKNIDKDKSVLNINGYCVDYLRDYNGKDVKRNYPFKVDFEFPVNLSEPEKTTKLLKLLFKVKKNITEIVFEGKFIEGGTVVQATYDDLPDDVKAYVDMGIYTLEEAQAKCTVTGSRERRMLLIRPAISNYTNEEGETVIKVQKTEDKYEEDDLDFTLPSNDEDTDDVSTYDDTSPAQPISVQENADLMALLASNFSLEDEDGDE